ncbi:conserved hypothetical protein [Candidatus Sulfopaludibacter sp. SbA4]|nr:conserved hypothetical protein [Candidatus Sulfopaludibacter sp. SbA4]
MDPSKGAVIPVSQGLQPKWSRSNTMIFPQALREAIPTTPGCWGRALELASIDGDCCNSAFYGRQTRLKFVVRETGKLTGVFEVHAQLNLEAARALAKTLSDLVEQAERMPQTLP